MEDGVSLVGEGSLHHLCLQHHLVPTGKPQWGQFERELCGQERIVAISLRPEILMITILKRNLVYLERKRAMLRRSIILRLTPLEPVAGLR